ncbi:MAG TPA: hypothetical protein VLW53_10495, partial [Candidatus Eisenbacteria bacterium]|nr:hypothetical protein [Candidatus Eisenbacteria bacterium]
LAEARLGDSELLLAVQEAEQVVARTRAMADALQSPAALRALAAASDAGAPGPPEARPGEAEVADELIRMEEELLWGPQAPEGRGPQDEPGR